MFYKLDYCLTSSLIFHCLQTPFYHQKAELIFLTLAKVDIPYDSLSSVHFQMDIGAPKWHLFDQQFCEGVLQIFCKQRLKGLGKIPKFWPLHSVRQNIAGFRRGLFVCFLGHAPLLQYYLLFGPHHFFIIVIKDVAQKAGNTVIRGCGPKSRQIDPSWNLECFAAHCAGVKIWEFCLVLLATVYKMSGEPPRKIASQKDAI